MMAWLRRMLQPDLLIAALIPLLLFAGVHAADRMVDDKIELACVLLTLLVGAALFAWRQARGAAAHRVPGGP